MPLSAQAAEFVSVNISQLESRILNIAGLKNFVILNNHILRGRIYGTDQLEITGGQAGHTLMYVFTRSGRRITYAVDVMKVILPVKPRKRFALVRYTSAFAGYHSYRMRAQFSGSSTQGALSPIWDHNFNFRWPLGRRSRFSASATVIEDPRLRGQGGKAPFSGHSRFAYARMDYLSPPLDVSLGDVGVSITPFAFPGFAIRGGNVTYRWNKDRPEDLVEVSAGYATPILTQPFFDVNRERLYSVKLVKELLPGMSLTTGFAFADNRDAPLRNGNQVPNDAVGVLFLDWKEPIEDLELELEFGRNRNTQAYRLDAFYDRYWGTVALGYNRVEPGYFAPGRGSVAVDQQSVTATFYSQPIEPLKYRIEYNFFNSNLRGDPTQPTLFRHRGITSAGYRINEKSRLIGSYSFGHSKAGGTTSLSHSTDLSYFYHFSLNQRLSVETDLRISDFNSATQSQSRWVASLNTAYSSEYGRFSVTGGQDFSYSNRRDQPAGAAATRDQAATLNLFAGSTYNSGFINVGLNINYGLNFSGSSVSRNFQPSLYAFWRPSSAYEFSLRGTYTRSSTPGTGATQFYSVVGQMELFFGRAVPDKPILHLFKKGKILGEAFFDLNENGLRDPGEEPLADAEIELDKETLKTNSEGRFRVKKDPGVYRVAINQTALPEGYRLTTASPTEAIVRSRKKVKVPFGVSNTGILTCKVFNDVNGNKISDLEDDGVGGVRVKVTHNGETQTLTTNDNGTFQVPTPQPGLYDFEIDMLSLPPNYQFVGKLKQTVTLDAKEFELVYFRTQALRSIYGKIYFDKNGNGRFDSDEKIVPNVRLRINGRSYNTGKEGAFLFKDLKPGTYKIELVPGTFPSRYKAKVDSWQINIGNQPKTVELLIPLVKR